MAQGRNEHVNGVKYPATVFCDLSYFDIIKHCGIDIMHLIFVCPSGVIPKMIKMWINSGYVYDT